MNILKNSFNNRQQIVKYNDIFSEPIDVISGVLQGGVLSPTLFNVYVADIADNIECQSYIFADDFVLVKKIYNENDCNSLQNDLNKVYNYCNANSLRLNPEKCEFIRFSLKKTNIFEYEINNTIIKNVDNHKHIGIVYDNKMCFNFHIDMIVEKALKKFYTLRYICKKVNPKVFLKLYQTYVLPILEYHNMCVMFTETQSKRLESVQKRVTKFICFKFNKTYLKYDKRLELLNIDSLLIRRKLQLLKTIFKIKMNFTNISENWKNELIFYESSRNGVFCKINLNRINLSDKYIFDYCVKLFNCLPLDVRNECKFNTFVNKSKLFLINH